MRSGEILRAKRFVSVAVVMLVLVAGALLLAGCSQPAASSSGGGTSSTTAFAGSALTGAGATFPGPVYSQWAQDFTKVESERPGELPGDRLRRRRPAVHRQDRRLRRHRRLAAGIGDRARSPTRTSSSRPASARSPSPTTSPGVTGTLKLDGPTIAKIFLGKIKKWNDPAIAALNSGVTLPATPIQVVHRSDDSGTTSIFTTWLKGQSPDWASKVGADKSVQWPIGQGGNGNAGVAAAMKQTEGSIGYVELQYALASNCPSLRSRPPTARSWLRPRTASPRPAARSSFPITPDDQHPGLEGGRRVPDLEHDVHPDLHEPDRLGEGADAGGLLDLGADQGAGRSELGS